MINVKGNDTAFCQNSSAIKREQLAFLFFDEFMQTNDMYASTTFWEEITQKLGGPKLPLTLLLSVLMGTLSSILLYYGWKSPNAHTLFLAGAEACAIGMIVVPAFLPFPSFRFFFGLLGFLSFMSLQRRIFGVKDVTKCEQSMSGHIIATFAADVYQRLQEKSSPALPSLSSISFLAMTGLLTDVVLYLAKEWIPVHVTDPVRQWYGRAVLMGVWSMFCMEFCYTVVLTFFRVVGYPVPAELEHRSPLLSTSLAEFWGVRWNPVTSRLLQAAFYKPLRYGGLPRWLCVVGCFAGSAALHSIPIYYSTYIVRDTATIGIFFLTQGVLVLLEQTFFSLTNPKTRRRNEKKQLPPITCTATTTTKDVKLKAEGNSSTVTPSAVKEGASVELLSAQPEPVRNSRSDEQGLNKVSDSILKTREKEPLISPRLAVSSSMKSDILPPPDGDSGRDRESRKIESPSVGALYIVEWIGEKSFIYVLCCTAGYLSAAKQRSIVTEVSIYVMLAVFLYCLLLTHGGAELLAKEGGREDALKRSAATTVVAVDATSTINEVQKKESSVLSDRPILHSSSTLTAPRRPPLANFNLTSFWRYPHYWNRYSSTRGTALTKKVLCVVLGWVWTVSAILLTLPLFTVPVDNAFQSTFPRSFLAGPLVRAIHQYYSR
jgi:hypothetical protein